jgi:hypothetical protein
MANANDPFDDYNPSLHDPGDDVYPISPDDANPLPTAVRALRATTAGTIQVTTRNGHVRVLAFAAAETRQGRVVKVWSTNTTATGIEGHV